MSHLLIEFFLFIIGFFSISCKKDESINQAPSCIINSPVDGVEILIGTTITILVSADDLDGFINEVRLNFDEKDIGLLQSSPYSFLLNSNDMSLGKHIIQAFVKDNNGISSSAEISIYIVNAIINNETATVNDYDGHIYKTIKIGDQWWMAENLKATHYSDGTKIQLVESSNNWISLNSEEGAMCYYDNSSTTANDYGALYTWAAAKEACPDGWHLPSDQEWKELEIQLGMSQNDADNVNNRGTNEGSKLSRNYKLWRDGALKNDVDFGTSGFNAIPGGGRFYLGEFDLLGDYAAFWTASEKSYGNASYRTLYFNSPDIFRGSEFRRNGLSVRCVKD